MWALLLTNWKPIASGLAILAVLGASFGTGYHYGGLSSQVQLLQSQEKAEATDASQAHQALLLTQTAMTQQQEIVDAYDKLKDLPDPVSAGILTRLQVLTNACPVLREATSAGGAPAASPVAGGDAGAAGLLEHASRALQACARDSAQLDALIKVVSQ